MLPPQSAPAHRASVSASLSASGQPLLLLDAPSVTLYSHLVVSIAMTATCAQPQFGNPRVLEYPGMADFGSGE